MKHHDPHNNVAMQDEPDRAPSEKAPAAPADPLKQAQAETAEFKDKFLRAQAEIANVTRRLTDERALALRNANATFARELLTVVDNFERLIASVADRPADDPVVKGAKLTYDSLLKVLRNHGVEPIETVGKPFDPRLHEAILHQPSNTVPEGHVAAEMTRGYKMNDRVLRAAVVAVAKKPDDHHAGQKGGH
jgi:molecular chaperone GrpE